MSAITAEPLHSEDHAHHEDVGFVRKYLWTYDHKMIGLQYLWTALAFLFLGGGLALLVLLPSGIAMAVTLAVSSRKPRPVPVPG